MCYQVTVTVCWPHQTWLTKLTRTGYRYQNTIDVQYVTEHCPVWPGLWTTLNSSYLFSYEYTDSQDHRTDRAHARHYHSSTDILLHWIDCATVPPHHFLILPVSLPTYHSQLRAHFPSLFTLLCSSPRIVYPQDTKLSVHFDKGGSFNLMIVTLLITSEPQLPELRVEFIFY